jgi:type III restriction enzyme
VVAIDTKGDHLIVQDAGRKLFYIEAYGTGPRLEIRLVTEGEWHNTKGEIGKSGPNGYTVWALRQGRPHPTYCRTVKDAVDACIQG